MSIRAIVVAAAVGLMATAGSSAAGIGVSPRVALPQGDFGDVAGLGFGAAVTMDKEVKDKPGRVGLVFLKFGEEEIFGIKNNVSAIGAFAGYKHSLGGLYLKVDTTLYRISTEAKAAGISVDDSEMKIKVSPGVGYQQGPLGAEFDIDLAMDWAGINIYYMLGN